MIITLWEHWINWFVWFCAAGESFFAGTALLIFAALFPTFRRKTRSNPVIYSFTIVGVFLVVLSGTPLPLWFRVIWAAAFFAFLLFVGARISRSLKSQFSSRAIAVCFCVIALLMELPFHLKPDIPQGRYEKLYIIGDSVSAGIGGTGEQTWPKILRSKYGIDVIDLSVPGATTASAICQADKVDYADAIVLLETGGNDIFEPTSYRRFEENLRQILEKVKNPKRAIMMLELPLLPWRPGYGMIQRKLAKEFGAVLIPKHFLCGVFSTQGATVDLAHLSADGHKLMAEKMRALLKDCLVVTEKRSGN